MRMIIVPVFHTTSVIHGELNSIVYVYYDDKCTRSTIVYIIDYLPEKMYHHSTM